MTRAQRIQLQLSERRERMAVILDVDREERSEEQTAELETLTREVRGLEGDYRAALLAEPDPQETRSTEPAGQDPETRERLELRSRFRIGRVLGAMAASRAIDGAEAEYLAAAESEGKVPVDVFETRDEGRERETRAVTPGVEGGTSQRPIVPALFKRTVLPFLNVGMPSAGMGDQAFPVLQTSVTAGAKAKDAALPQTAGAFTVSSQQPRRLGASFKVRYEDLARLEGMEPALRRNMQDAVAATIDEQALNGAAAALNTDGEIRGLLAQLTDPDDPDAGAETWARYHGAAVSHLTDPWAVTEADVRLLLGEATYRHAASEFRTDDRDESFTAYWNRVGGGVRMSGKLAAPASNIQQAVVVRANPAGDEAAVMPHWSGFDLSIRDVYTEAGKGQVIVTVHVLVGDVVVLRPSVYVQDSFRLAA